MMKINPNYKNYIACIFPCHEKNRIDIKLYQINQNVDYV